jgi:iron complex transport system permease protein
MRIRRAALLLPAALCALLAVCLLSLAVGALPLGPAAVRHGLTGSGSAAYPVVHGLRLPRTLLRLPVGLALGLAGALMQASTRNPSADPGLLGVNAGASAAVVTATALFGISSVGGYIWFALGGAALVSVLIYAVGGAGSGSPARLALAGTAVNAALFSCVGAVELLDTDALDRMRFWTVGSLADADLRTAARITPFVLAAAVVLLCGAATAACGPIVFVGLMIPRIAARLTGPDLRRVLPPSALLGPVLLLGADVLGRVVARPSELEVGVVTAVLGGPFFLLTVVGRRA